MVRKGLCDYSGPYILVKETIIVLNTAAAGADTNNTSKKVIPVTSCMSRINNTQIDDDQYTDMVMPMYNVIEYSDNFSKTSGVLWQYCRDVPAVDNDGAITDFTEANATTDLFNLKKN